MELWFAQEDIAYALEATGHDFEAAAAWLLGDYFPPPPPPPAQQEHGDQEQPYRADEQDENGDDGRGAHSGHGNIELGPRWSGVFGAHASDAHDAWTANIIDRTCASGKLMASVQKSHYMKLAWGVKYSTKSRALNYSAIWMRTVVSSSTACAAVINPTQLWICVISRFVTLPT